MSSFPSFPACDGPLSLKQFLSRYLLVDVVFTSSAGTQDNLVSPDALAYQQGAPSRRLALPLTAHLVLSVYVLKNAPPPPTWTPATRPTATSSSLSSPPPFAKSAQHKCVTSAVLADPFFSALFAALGPAVEAYVLSSCPVVAQFEVYGGGLQVLGPSLLALVPLTSNATTSRMHRQPTDYLATRKRPRSHDSGSAHIDAQAAHGGRDGRDRRTRRSLCWSAERQRQNQRTETTGTRGEAEGTNNDKSTDNVIHELVSITKPPPECVSTSRRADYDASARHRALLTLNVSRTVLLDRKAARMPQWSCASAEVEAVCWTGADDGARVPDRWMDALWAAAHDTHGRAARTPSTHLSSLESGTPTCTLLPPEAQHKETQAHESPQREDDKKSSRRSRRRRRRHRHGHPLRHPHAPQRVTNTMCLDQSAVTAVPDAWVPLVFPLTTVTLGVSREAARDPRAGVLVRVLASIAHQCRRLDVRGLALRHTQFLESRFLAMQQDHHRLLQTASSSTAKAHTPRTPFNHSVFDVARLTAPVPIVVSYVRDILVRLQWPPAASPGSARMADASPPGRCKPHTYSTFWGVDEASAEANITSLCCVLRDWLHAGRRGLFPLSRFLHGVHVGRIPWLLDLSMTAATPAPATPTAEATYSRGRQSQTAQRAFLECIFFLLQHVIPFFLESAFHVTWRSREPNTLVFIPVAVWRRLVRRELRHWCRPTRTAAIAGAAPQNEAEKEEERDDDDDGGARDACGDVHETRAPLQTEMRTPAVRPVQRSDEVWRRATTCPLPSRVLYATVRFLPDKHKLRPIAVVRCGSARALSLLARGIPRTSVRVPCARQTPSASAATPSILLRTALACLVSGLDAQRSAQGLPPFTNRTHKDEYPELRALAAEYQRLWYDYLTAQQADVRSHTPHDLTPRSGREDATAPDTPPRPPLPLSEGPMVPPVLSLIHADATRCYDRLPQSTVAAAIDALVTDDVYYAVNFTAIQATAPRRRPMSRHAQAQRRGMCSKRARSSSPPAPPQRRVRAGRERAVEHLRQFQWRRMVPAEQLRTRRIVSIPRATILCEPVTPNAHTLTATAAAAMQGGCETTSNNSVEALTGRVVNGAAVRALLLHHTQHHLIVVPPPHDPHTRPSSAPSTRSALFSQDVGITQGSPVAMLLCDVVLQHVDAALARCLSGFHEYSMLLRRVDDVLVASTSPVAAEACVTAIQNGWEAVGYQCEPKKLQYVRGRCFGDEDTKREGLGRASPSALPADDAMVSWCGLRVSAHTAEVAIDWQRVHPIIASLHRTSRTCVSLMAGQDGGAAVGERRLGTNVHRLLTILALRVPPVALCRHVNSRVRVLRTFFELSLISARFLCRQFAVMLPRARPRARLLLGPSLLCERRLVRLLEHRCETLVSQYNSFCDITADEVRLCWRTALHRTWQSQLRCRLAASRPPRRTQEAYVARAEVSPSPSLASTHVKRRHRPHQVRRHAAAAAAACTARRRQQLWWALARKLSGRGSRAMRRNLAQHYTARHRMGTTAAARADRQATPLVLPWCAADGFSAASLLQASGQASLTNLALAAVKARP